MRVVSLLPAATEIVGVLGQLESLVGISHECDYPLEVNGKPRVTRCSIHTAGLQSAEIDRRVRESLATTGTLYSIDEPLLRSLKPDLILTQGLCDVCAVGYGSVMELANTLSKRAQVINLEPSCLDDIFENIRCVARALEIPEQGDAAIAALIDRVSVVRSRVAHIADRPKCFLMEWIDPPFCSGHWGPELVALAGGIEPIGIAGNASVQVPWERVIQAQPDIIVLACCGYRTEKTLGDIHILRGYPDWENLPAVRYGRVHIVDGNAYFSRPGPRIVDGLEILAEIIHPELFAGSFPDRKVMSV